MTKSTTKALLEFLRQPETVIERIQRMTGTKVVKVFDLDGEVIYRLDDVEEKEVELTMQLKLIPISSIITRDRARQVYNKIDQLADSIKQHGLIEPLVVKDLREEKYLLVAGGRRLAACILAGVAEVPASVYPTDSNDIELRIVELIENTERENLTWQEEIKIRRDIHTLLTEQNSENSMHDTARKLGLSIATVSRDLQLAKDIEAVSILARCETKADANRLIKKLAIHVENQNATATFEAAHAKDTSKYSVLADWYKIDNFLTADIPDNSFDLVEVDPPYGIDLINIKYLESHSNRLELERLYTEIDSDVYPEFLYLTMLRSYAALKKDGWILFWYAMQYHSLVFELLKKVGFVPATSPYIWFKAVFGQCTCPQYLLSSCYEQCMYAHKGTPKINIPGSRNCEVHYPVNTADKIHPTERPMDLMRSLVTIFSHTNDSVLVPFAGSGVTLRAAFELKRTALGFDLCNEYRNAFIRRLKDEGN